jgi:hypothetical protein
MTPTAKRNGVILLLLLLGVLGFVVYRVQEGAGRGGVVGLVTPPRVTTIASSEEMEIPATSLHKWQWDVRPEQPNCRLTGHIEVTQGGNKDVQVFVLTADDYANLANGHDARAFFQTDKTTSVTLDVATSAPGPKVLAVSNAFSMFTPKRVQLSNVQVTCQ